MPDVPTVPPPTAAFSDLTAAQLRSRFEEKEASLKQHVTALSKEVRGLVDDGEEAVQSDPSKTMAAVAIGAVAVGLLVGWKKRNVRSNEDDDLGELLDGYSDAFAEEVSEWIDKGKSVGEAVSHALRGVRPVVYFEPPPERAEPRSTRSKVKKTAGSLAKAAFGYALRAALAEVSNTVAGRRR